MNPLLLILFVLFTTPRGIVKIRVAQYIENVVIVIIANAVQNPKYAINSYGICFDQSDATLIAHHH